MKKLYLILIILSGLCGKGFASSGASALEFLRLDTGPREVAMGGAAVSAGNATHGVYYNPALLLNDRTYRNQVSFSYSDWLMGINYQDLFFTHQNKDDSGWTFRIQRLSYGDIDGFDSGGAKTSNVDAGDFLAGITYARKLFGVNTGLTLKYVRETLDSASTYDFLGDIGLSYDPMKNMRVGFSVRNIGPDVKFDETHEQVPTVGALGVSYKMFDDFLLASLDGESPRGGEMDYRAGLEAKLYNTLFLRGGFDSSLDAASGFRFGAGIAYKSLKVDYTFLPISDLGNTHHIGLTYAFNNWFDSADKAQAKSEAVTPEPVVTQPVPANPAALPVLADTATVPAAVMADTAAVTAISVDTPTAVSPSSAPAVLIDSATVAPVVITPAQAETAPAVSTQTIPTEIQSVPPEETPAKPEAPSVPAEAIPVLPPASATVEPPAGNTDLKTQ